MTDTRSIESWLDALNAIWGFDTGRGTHVQTPKCVTKNEFPESLPKLADAPVALSWPLNVSVEYGDPNSSMPTILIWNGETELHLTPDVKKTNLAFILPFFGRILNAAKTNYSLGGKVVYFHLAEDNSMELVSELRYGSEAPHHGIIIRWVVKQDLSGLI